jgi:hypothetical protein
MTVKVICTAITTLTYAFSIAAIVVSIITLTGHRSPYPQCPAEITYGQQAGPCAEPQP